MDTQIIDERRRKANIIIDLYKSRDYRQEDIAKKLNIPEEVVARVTKEANYEHTICKTPENLKGTQKINPIIDYTKMDYLDQYNF